MKLDLSLRSRDVTWNPEEQKYRKAPSLMTWVQNSRDVHAAGGQVRSELSRQTLGQNWKPQEAFPSGMVKAESSQRWRGFQALTKPSVETGRRKAVPSPEQIVDAQLQGEFLGLSDQKQKEECVNMISGL